MNVKASDQCCPRFDPAPWDEKEISWQDKRFVKDRVTSILPARGVGASPWRL